jgi:hypothetical protein
LIFKHSQKKREEKLMNSTWLAGRRTKLAATLILALATVGCGTLRETLTARSALEQLLISTAADRAIDSLPLTPLQHHDIFVETANLECYDKPYVNQRVRQAVLRAGGRLVPARDKADLILEVACGGLAVDRGDSLLGLPQLNLPIPLAGSLETPELAVFKKIYYNGRAKFIFNLVDARTNQQMATIPIAYGKTREAYIWFFLLGPFRQSDLPTSLK